MNYTTENTIALKLAQTQLKLAAHEWALTCLANKDRGHAEAELYFSATAFARAAAAIDPRLFVRFEPVDCPTCYVQSERG